MTDAYPGPGPLGVRPTVTSTLQVAECASLTFDRRGRHRDRVRRGDHADAEAVRPQDAARSSRRTACPTGAWVSDVFSDFSGGGYFYLDHRDRAVIPTGTNHIQVVGQNAAGNRLRPAA